MTTSTTIDRVRSLVTPIVSDLGLEIYDLEQRGGTLRVTIDTPAGSPGGVDLDIIATVTRLVSRELDHTDPIPGKYTLEVTSPGVERALRTPEHFVREVGKVVSVRLADTTADERRFEGVLTACDGVAITLRFDDGGEREIPVSHIDRAKTVFHWGPKPKPGGPRVKKPRTSGASSTSPADHTDNGTDTEEQP